MVEVFEIDYLYNSRLRYHIILIFFINQLRLLFMFYKF